MELLFLTFLIGTSFAQHSSFNYFGSFNYSSRSSFAAVSNGDLFAFGGGFRDGMPLSSVDILDTSSLDYKRYSIELSVARGYLGSASIENLFLFAGGGSSLENPSSLVDIYDISYKNWSTSSLSIPRLYPSGSSFGQYAFFAGGRNTTSLFDTVDIFDSSSYTWNTSSLSIARSKVASTCISSLCFFGGGELLEGTSDVVDIYDIEARNWTVSYLSSNRSCTAISLGDYVYFSGELGGLLDKYNYNNRTWKSFKISWYDEYTLSSIGNTVYIVFNGEYGVLGPDGYGQVTSIPSVGKVPTISNGVTIVAASNTSRLYTYRQKVCVSGYYSPNKIEPCYSCYPGSYSKAPASECTPCPIGKYTTDAGAAYCSTCPPGKTSLGNTSSCYDCPIGTKGKGGICSLCPAGGYNPQGGSSSCYACKAGSYQPNNGSSYCFPCNQNTYSFSGATECISCRRGFCSGMNQTACSPCETKSPDLGVIAFPIIGGIILITVVVTFIFITRKNSADGVYVDLD